MRLYSWCVCVYESLKQLTKEKKNQTILHILFFIQSDSVSVSSSDESSVSSSLSTASFIGCEF